MPCESVLGEEDDVTQCLRGLKRVSRGLAVVVKGQVDLSHNDADFENRVRNESWERSPMAPRWKSQDFEIDHILRWKRLY